jgi:hypothetical protein
MMPGATVLHKSKEAGPINRPTQPERACSCQTTCLLRRKEKILKIKQGATEKQASSIQSRGDLIRPTVESSIKRN